MISQKRKNSIKEASTTCKAKLNSGPVNRIPTVMVHRMMNPRIRRVRWLGFFMGNSLGGCGCLMRCETEAGFLARLLKKFFNFFHHEKVVDF